MRSDDPALQGFTLKALQREWRGRQLHCKTVSKGELECADSTYYCGVAKHVERRLAQHNGLQAGGAKYTRSRRPVKLLAFRACRDKRSAYSLEYAVKAVPREKKLAMLLTHEPKT